ncbi:MAG: cytochrome c, partial [Calothrix sp. SM1_5_4]|nr:cytochrome c [Calothrix sp. SM1_5_4]
MDFPLFHLDLMGNRLLIAIIATLHVVISHSLGVGGMAIVAWMERKGLTDPDWDAFAKRTLFSFFVVTTTVGALTGVGIWFS